MAPYRLLLADDFAVVRAGVRALLADEPDLSIVGEATTADEAVQRCAELEPDLLLLDLQMPGPTPAETIAALRERTPTTRVVILTAHRDVTVARTLSALGATGYVLKDDPPEALAQAIRAAMGGGAWLSQSMLPALAGETPGGGTNLPTSPAPRLSARERAVLALLADEARDLTYAEIARTLGIKESSVTTYVKRLSVKLSVPLGGRRAVVRAAHEQGLL